MENHSKKSSDADFRYQLKDRIERFESPEDVFDLVRCLDYPPSSIREQDLASPPDRKALDDVVFDAIGLTDDERKEVYWAVTELVKRAG